MKNINEKLRLIAEFDGFVYTFDDEEAYPQGYMYSEEHGALRIEDFEYDKSWDWIMPIFAKIIDWYDDNDIDLSTNSNLMEGIYHVDLDIFFNDIYETIKWINTHEKNRN